MSWQIPLYVGFLYFCLGLAILNSGILNNGFGTAAAATVATSILILQPIPTALAAGYLPYKPSALPWLDNMGAVWIDGDSERRKRQEQGTSDRYGGKNITIDDLFDCQDGKKSCRSLGHPEVCCNEAHTCLPTNNTLAGVYCCGSPDPVTLPCDDTNLQCEPDWHQCPESVNGGCCKYGQICGLLECYKGGGPTTPTPTFPPITTRPGNDSTIEDGDNITVEISTLSYTFGVNTTITITSTSSRITTTTTIPFHRSTALTADMTLTGTAGSGTAITYGDPNRPGVNNVGSAAGSRAQVGRHWSWAVMAWWVAAAIVEGV